MDPAEGVDVVEGVDAAKGVDPGGTGYLTLVHVPWRLVEVREGSQVGHIAQHARGVEFHVSGDWLPTIVLDNFTAGHGDVHVDLLEAAC